MLPWFLLNVNIEFSVWKIESFTQSEYAGLLGKKNTCHIFLPSSLKTKWDGGGMFNHSKKIQLILGKNLAMRGIKYEDLGIYHVLMLYILKTNMPGNEI